ncbi:MAG: hypothetical protein U0556_12015 [Dehalococcoidia bacterium]
MNPTQTPPTIQDPRPQYFDDANLDRVMAVIITMANELWVTKDRLMILERMIAKRGGISPDQLDRYQPTDEERGELEAARKTYIARVLSGLTIDPRPVAEIRAEKGIAPLR